MCEEVHHLCKTCTVGKTSITICNKFGKQGAKLEKPTSYRTCTEWKPEDVDSVARRFFDHECKRDPWPFKIEEEAPKTAMAGEEVDGEVKDNGKDNGKGKGEGKSKRKAEEKAKTETKKKVEANTGEIE